VVLEPSAAARGEPSANTGEVKLKKATAAAVPGAAAMGKNLNMKETPQ
jgi:hypothetical protein